MQTSGRQAGCCLYANKYLATTYREMKRSGIERYVVAKTARSRRAESGGVATRNRAESPRGIGWSRRAASSGRTTESTRRPFFVVFAASTYIENRERVSIAVYLDVFLLENIEENIKRTDLRLFCCVSLHRELRNESNRC